jgi:hypothetical protein
MILGLAIAIALVAVCGLLLNWRVTILHRDLLRRIETKQ